MLAVDRSSIKVSPSSERRYNVAEIAALASVNSQIVNTQLQCDREFFAAEHRSESLLANQIGSGERFLITSDVWGAASNREKKFMFSIIQRLDEVVLKMFRDTDESSDIGKALQTLSRVGCLNDQVLLDRLGHGLKDIQSANLFERTFQDTYRVVSVGLDHSSVYSANIEDSINLHPLGCSAFGYRTYDDLESYAKHCAHKVVNYDELGYSLLILPKK